MGGRVAEKLIFGKDAAQSIGISNIAFVEGEIHDPAVGDFVGIFYCKWGRWGREYLHGSFAPTKGGYFYEKSKTIHDYQNAYL